MDERVRASSAMAINLRITTEGEVHASVPGTADTGPCRERRRRDRGSQTAEAPVVVKRPVLDLPPSTVDNSRHYVACFLDWWRAHPPRDTLRLEVALPRPA